jgi:hypothetical protein
MVLSHNLKIELARDHPQRSLEQALQRLDYCPICKQEDWLIYLKGDLYISRLGRRNDLVVFELISRGILSSHWLIDLPYYDEPRERMVSQAELLKAINQSPEHVAKITLVGGCAKHAKQWAAYFSYEKKSGPNDFTHSYPLVSIDPRTLQLDNPLDFANQKAHDCTPTMS